MLLVDFVSHHHIKRLASLGRIKRLAAGIPLVSTDGGALSEVVGEGGLQVPAGDSTALADAIDRVLSDSELADELAQRGPERVRQHFCWSVCAGQMVDLYRKSIAAC